jgi:suppressor for copper-sensitivity B
LVNDVGMIKRIFHARALAAGLAALIVVGAGISDAGAAASKWWQSDHGSVRLIAESDFAGDQDTLKFGLQFRMKPGWKIYWRSPGDAGFPPQPNWAGSRNMAETKVSWPAPVRFSVLGLETLGYKGETVLPLTVALFEPGKAVDMRAKIPFLACSEICIPYEASVSLALPQGPETTSRESGLIERFAARVPTRDKTSGLRIDRAEIAGSGGSQVIQLALASDKMAFGKPDIYTEGPAGFRFSRPISRLSEDGRTALMRIAVKTRNKKFATLAGRSLTFTVVDGDRAIERDVKLTATVGIPNIDGRPAEKTTFSGMAAILAFALLGGLILNLMPCVLPVLSIKLLSLVAHGGGQSRQVRLGFLASAAGILASFLVLGTVAVFLKSAGLAAGWGIQFQQPVFLAIMVFILVLFAGNLWGLFEFRLPGAMTDHAAQAGGGHGMTGHFLTGAFATLLATPCSAPFLGTAVGFALSRGPLEIYAVFVALGVGLAAPYFLVAGFPALATRLPRPGPWMVTLRRVLSLALIATAGWLVSVLFIQVGLAVAILVTLFMAAIWIAIWQLRQFSERTRRATWVVVVALGVLSTGISGSFARFGQGPDISVKDAVWQKFDPARIAREVATGRRVFVDVTADWCITCQVNKALVLKQDDILGLLKSDAVIAMKADWTRPDPVISDFLASFGRYGIPFNVVYGPGAPQGKPLPEILTRAAVMNAMTGASKVAGK